MTSIMICALICLTVIFCVVFIVHKGLPPIIIERREMEWVPKTEDPNHIEFTDTKEDKPSEDEKVPSEKEEMEKVLQDVASTVTALFRGEVDISELN